MQVYDIIVTVLLVAAALWGARRGFAKQVASLASLLLGYFVAVQFRQPLATMIEAPEPWNLFAAMLALFVGTSLLIWIAFRFVSGTIDRMGLQGFDRQMGGLFGLMKGVLLATAMTMFVAVMLGDRGRAEVVNSYSGYTICQALTTARPLIPAEWYNTMEPYMRQLHEQHQHEHQLADHPLGDLIEPPAQPWQDPGYGQTDANRQAGGYEQTDGYGQTNRTEGYSQTGQQQQTNGYRQADSYGQPDIDYRQQLDQASRNPDAGLGQPSFGERR